MGSRYLIWNQMISLIWTWSEIRLLIWFQFDLKSNDEFDLNLIWNQMADLIWFWSWIKWRIKLVAFNLMSVVIRWIWYVGKLIWINVMLNCIFQNQVDDLNDVNCKTTHNMMFRVSICMLNEKVRLMLLRTDSELELDVWVLIWTRCDESDQLWWITYVDQWIQPELIDVVLSRLYLPRRLPQKDF